MGLEKGEEKCFINRDVVFDESKMEFENIEHVEGQKGADSVSFDMELEGSQPLVQNFKQ